MNLLDLTFPTPAENLACDEALLDWCEEEGADEILRFWEPDRHFVVLGYSNKMAAEVELAACCEDGIPIFRRCSGGGTVLQGPGCLNYGLILRIGDSGPRSSVAGTNRQVMERHQAAIERLAGVPVEMAGHTDLAIAGRKFSGNSQRRKRRYLLFHGTFLLQFDLALIVRWLRMPSRQPPYRQNRPHDEFLMNLPVQRPDIQAALCETWGGSQSLDPVPRESIHQLATGKYLADDWTRRF